MVHVNSILNISVILAILIQSSVSFLPISKTSPKRIIEQPASASSSTERSTNKINGGLSAGDRVLLVGPGFLQLNVAKAAKAAGLIPMIVAPQTKLDTFRTFINDNAIMSNADIGLPDEKGTVSGVVFCSEEAVFGADLVKTILEWEGGYVDAEGPKRVIACIPVSKKVNEVKSMGWAPIFNNDKNKKEIWSKFTEAFLAHPISSGPAGSVVRVGSLLGGSIDGSPELQPLGLDERVYKMSLENYRDMRERAFDRYRIGAQILQGDAINPKPSNRDKLEKQAIPKGIDLEVFRATGGYPEEDRTCRHTAAQAIVQALLRPTRGTDGQFTILDESDKSVPKEFTVLSKCLSNLPTVEEWDQMFLTPSPAQWPDPSLFDPTLFETADVETQQ